MAAELLAPSDLSRHLETNAVTCVLVLDSGQRYADSLVGQLRHVSAHDPLGEPFHDRALDADDLTLTPVLLFFRGNTLVATDMTGQANIERSLTHENIAALFGQTRGGATLIE